MSLQYQYPGEPVRSACLAYDAGIALDYAKALDGAACATLIDTKAPPALRRHAPLGVAIESFWMDESNRRTHAGIAHRDINEVMLATCLQPEGFLRLNDASARPLRATLTAIVTTAGLRAPKGA